MMPGNLCKQGAKSCGFYRKMRFLKAALFLSGFFSTNNYYIKKER